LDEISSYNREDPLVLRLLHLIQVVKKEKIQNQWTRDEELEWLTW
jgi:hypothetical protein